MFRQGRSKWAARFASVRLNSRAPWEQKRQIVGMVKSPVEGNSIVILKMDKPVIFSGNFSYLLITTSQLLYYLGSTANMAIILIASFRFCEANMPSIF